MTKEECAIITAYSGYAMLTGDDLDIFYKYCEKILDRPVITSDFVWDWFWIELHEKSKPDFERLCREATS